MSYSFIDKHLFVSQYIDISHILLDWVLGKNQYVPNNIVYKDIIEGKGYIYLNANLDHSHHRILSMSRLVKRSLTNE